MLWAHHPLCIWTHARSYLFVLHTFLLKKKKKVKVWSALILPGCVLTPRGLAVRRGTAPLVLQVAWEAELASRGEGLALLDNPKSAWSSHAKAAASGKDTRVLNLQNKERRTRDSLFCPAWARRCTYLRAIASVIARILGLWSHAICHLGFIHFSHATR